MYLKDYSDQNVAAIVEGDKTVKIIPRELPSIKDDEVLLSVTSVGICGSDLKYWAYGKCGRFKLDGMSMVIGHEGAGIVEMVGDKVTHLKKGDRVAIEPGVPCKNCEVCLTTDRYNLCPKMKFCATPPVHGNLCKYFVHDSQFCFKLPDHVSDEEGAMVEPLSVAVHTCRRAGVLPGHRILIFGSGPIGILCGLVAKQMGAVKVLIVDIADHRLKDAETYGAADLFYKVTKEDTDPSLLSSKLKSLFQGKLPHAAMECSGADSSLKTAMETVGPGSSVLLVGRGSPYVDLPMVAAGTFEIDIKGIFRYANTYPKAIEMIANGEIDVKQLITHRYTIDQSQQAFLAASDPAEKAIKVMINCASA